MERPVEKRLRDWKAPLTGSYFLFLGPGKSGKPIQCFVLGKNIMPMVSKTA